MIQNKVDALAPQEINIKEIASSARGNIPRYKLVEALGHTVYVVATIFQKSSLSLELLVQRPKRHESA